MSSNTESSAAATVRTFSILLDRKAGVDAALTKLAKRAARKGLPVLVWTWGKPVTEKVGLDHEGRPIDELDACRTVNITRCPLTLEGEMPRYAGWSFVAALQHLDGENIVRTLPEQVLPEEYRTRGPACDHCRASRRRSDTYVLRHEDGRVMQVGSTCLADFLDSDDAGSLAAQAEIWSLAAAIGEGGGEGCGGSSHQDRTLAEYLPVVAWAVREQGWLSRTKARDEGGVATADRAWDYVTSTQAARKAEVATTPEDVAVAEAAEAWAEALTDEAVNGESGGGDYLHNLRAIARTGLVERRTAGLAASIVIAHQRAVGRERDRAARTARPTLDVHLGTIGERVSFGLAAKIGKRGQALKNAPTVLSAEPLVLDFVTGYSTDYGYTTILKFRTVEGATVVWKSSRTEISRDCVGKSYTLSGTVSGHDEYKGQKQTLVTRCTVVEASSSSSETAAA